ncbi:MAG: hypothetical protein ACOCXM_00305 [Myxococcota bacterium]
MPQPEMKEEFQKTLSDLKSLREEIKVKVHLASMDVKDTWNKKLEPRVRELEQRAEGAADKTWTELKDAAQDLKTRLKKLREEL